MFFEKAKEIEWLKEQLADAQSLIDEYRCKMKDNDKVTREKIEKIDFLNTEIESLCNKSDSFVKNIQSLEKGYNDLKKEKEEVENKLNNALDEVDKLLQENLDLNSKSSSYVQDIENLEKEYARLKEQYDGAFAREKVFKDSYYTMKDQVVKVQQTIEGYIHDISDQKQIIKDLTGIVNAIIKKEFGADNIELALIKTYRNFEYLYKDGNFIDTNNAESIYIHYERDALTTVEVTK